MGILSPMFISLLLIVSFCSIGYAQTCFDRIKHTTPDNRFEVYGDEVTDRQTGLIWQRCSMGQRWDGSTCSGTAIEYYWYDGLVAAKKISLASEYSWRVPNVKELASIVENACVSPAINMAVFPNTSSDTYWSSTPFRQYSVYTWVVDFNSGTDRGQTSESYGFINHIRLVRDKE